ncbi:ADP-heptose--lipooligosaccharide heptosyltransferase II [hydrothermal vent metagenome]|uniref:lipopolysaccharide heptosyltransferase II n=1 Tax=hydrothermal vent metagenome TaxID=652676 RepID=A0A3B0V6Q7_9ZZZZ
MSDKENIKRILVRVPNWIGDAVISMPGLHALKRLYPGAEITVLAKARTLPLYLGKEPVVKDVIEYDPEGRHSGLAGKFRLVAELKTRRFQMAVLFQNAFEAALIAFMAGIPRRVGYARDLRTPLLTGPVKFEDTIAKKHQVFYYLNIIKELGLGVSLEEMELPIVSTGKEDSERAGAIMEEYGLGADSAMVGVAPGASFGPAKRWPVEGYCEVIERLCGERGMTPVIFGGADDIEVSTALSQRLSKAGVDHVNLAAKTSLREFMAIAGKARLFLTNDSGPMHVVAALGAPTVAVFVSTSPALTGPIGRSVKVLYKKLECGPCFKRECPHEHYNCMKTITPEDIYNASTSLLGGCGIEANSGSEA